MSKHVEEDRALYRCVACGAGAPALTRSYGPTVLKLAACRSCGSTVDKYIEYDPVIVMIDLILALREAQRHILHNTKFKTFWKLFVILAILETYGVWCKNNIINLGIEQLCHTNDQEQMNYNNATSTLNMAFGLSEFWQNGCTAWNKEVKVDDIDPFISEKAFYITFASVCMGTTAFTCVIHVFMKLAGMFYTGTNVSVLSLLKTITVGNMSNLFTLPLLIWGISDTQTNTIHVLLVFAYSFLVFLNVLSVMYNFNIYLTTGVLLLGYGTKFVIVYASKCIIDVYV